MARKHNLKRNRIKRRVELVHVDDMAPRNSRHGKPVVRKWARSITTNPDGTFTFNSGKVAIAVGSTKRSKGEE